MGTSIRWTTRMRALLRRWQGAPLTWLIAGGFVLMVAMAIGTALTVDRFRQNAIESGRDSLENSVRMLARHFDREFADFAVLQKSVIAELESHGIASADLFRSEMATLAMHEVLRAKASGWSDVAGANVFDSNGVLINSSRRWPVADISVADRGYFNRLRNDPASQEEIEVVPGRFGNGAAIVFARRVSGPTANSSAWCRGPFRRSSSNPSSPRPGSARDPRSRCTTRMASCSRAFRMSTR